MAEVKEFKVKITADAKDLVNSLQSGSGELKKLIQGIGKASDQMEVLNEASKRLSDMDKQLVKLKTDFPDVFKAVFGNIDAQIKDAMAPIMETPELMNKLIMQIGTKLQGITTGKMDATNSDMKELGATIQTLAEQLNLKVDFGFLDSTDKAKVKAEKLLDVMRQMVMSFYEVKEAAADASKEIKVEDTKPPKKGKKSTPTSTTEKSELTRDDVRKRIEEIRKLDEESLNKEDTAEADALMDQVEKKQEALRKALGIAKKSAKEFNDIILMSDGEIEEIMSKLEKMAGDKFPKAVQTAGTAVGEKVSSVLPTSDGLQQASVAVTEAQKNEVNKLAEEYRVIIDLLRKGGIESESTVNALKERASVIKDIIQSIKPVDMNLSTLLKDTYGMPIKTANYLVDNKTRGKLGIDSYKKSGITEDSRQEALNLIYQEIAAENQLIAKEKEEKAVIDDAINSLNQKSRLIMYHKGNLLNSSSSSRDTFGEMPYNLTGAVEDSERWKSLGFGILGGGLFGVANPSSITGDNANIKGTTYLQSIDLSKYNMYMADTEERASNLANFLSKLQKFTIKNEVPDFTGFDAELSGVTEDTLYQEFQNVFNDANMTKEKLLSFISEMRGLLKEAGITFDSEFGELDFSNKDSAILSSENISTRLLKQLGYQGVYTGNTSFGDFGQGSVLFDFNESDIIGYFNTLESAVQDYERMINGIDGSSWDGTIGQLEQYKTNIDEIVARITEYRSNFEGKPLYDSLTVTLDRLNAVKEQIDAKISGYSDGTLNNGASGVSNGSSNASTVIKNEADARRDNADAANAEAEALRKRNEEARQAAQEKINDFNSYIENGFEVSNISDYDHYENTVNEIYQVIQAMHELGVVTDEEMSKIDADWTGYQNRIAEGKKELQTQEATRSLDEFRALQDEISGKSSAAYGGSMDDATIGQYTERLNVAKAKLDELGTQSQLTAEQIKEANDIYEIALSSLEAMKGQNAGYLRDLEDRQGSSDNMYQYGYDDGYARGQEEISSLESQLTEARTQLESVRSQLAGAQNITNQASGVGIDVSAEVQQLETLREKLEAVKQAIVAKNKAFNDEGIIVGQVVGKEIAALLKLQNQIGDITTTIETKTEAFKEEGKAVEGASKKTENGKKEETKKESGTKDTRNNADEISKEAKAQAELKQQIQETTQALDEYIQKLGIKNQQEAQADNTSKFKIQSYHEKYGEKLNGEKLDSEGVKRRVDADVNYVFQQIEGILKGKSAASGYNGKINVASDLDTLERNREQLEAYKEILEQIGYTLEEPVFNQYDQTLTAKIVPIDGKAITDLEQARNILEQIFINPTSSNQSPVSDIPEYIQQALPKITELQERLKNITSADELTQWKQEWNQVTQSISQAKKEAEGIALSTQKNQLNGLKNSLGKAFKATGIDTATATGDDKELADRYTKLTARLETYAKIRRKLSNEEIQALQNEYNEIMQKAKAYENVGKQVKANVEYGKKTIETASGKRNALIGIVNSKGYGDSQEVVNALELMNLAYDDLVKKQQEFAGTDITDEKDQEFKALASRFEEARKKLQDLINTSKNLDKNAKWSENITGDISTSSGMEAELKKAVKQASEGRVKFGEFRKELGQLDYQVQNADGTWSRFTAQIDTTGNRIVGLTNKTKESKGIITSLFDGMGNSFMQAIRRFTGFDLFYKLVNQVKQGVQYVKEIDSALTELKKVTDETEVSYAKFLQTMSKTGAEIGATVSDLTTMAATWARLNIRAPYMATYR